MTIPAGWQQHPQSAAHMWNPTTNEIREIPAAPTAPPIPAAPAAPALAAAPAAHAQSYETSMAAVQAEHAAMAARSQGQFQKAMILDFDSFRDSDRVGTKQTMIVRLLPPYSAAAQGKAWAKTARYRLPADLCPWETGGKRWQYVDAFDQQGGPGDDPVAKALSRLMESGNDDAMKFAKASKARVRIYWQGLDLQDPQKHFQQETDQHGSPILDANGQPQWKVVPAVIPMGPQLHKAVLNFFLEKGDCTNPDAGYPMKLIKEKTGNDEMGVTYSAMDMDKAPLDPAFRPVLGNLIDLRDQMLWFHSREEMNELAQNILAKFGLGGGNAYAPSPAGGGFAPPPTPPTAQPPGGPWYPHPSMPGHLYNAAGHVIADPAVAAAPPPPPPPPAPPVAAAPPPMPPPPPAAPAAPPAPPASPYAAPSGLPPAVAPGLSGGLPPTPPVPPAVPPGMPPGVAAHPAAPPGPSMPPAPPMPPAVGGGMTGDELEQELGYVSDPTSPTGVRDPNVGTPF